MPVQLICINSRTLWPLPCCGQPPPQLHALPPQGPQHTWLGLCLQELYKNASNTRAESVLGASQGGAAALGSPAADDLARLLLNVSDPLTYTCLANCKEVEEAVAALVQVGRQVVGR